MEDAGFLRPRLGTGTHCSKQISRPVHSERVGKSVMSLDERVYKFTEGMRGTQVAQSVEHPTLDFMLRS